MIATTALLCLALNIYHEARGEQVPGQYAVAQVTLKRAEQNDTSACRETFKSKQFSWTTGVRKTGEGWLIPKHLRPKDVDAWKKALIISSVAMEGKMRDFTKGADHYHAKSVRPVWASKMQKVAVIGQHIFYIRSA